MSGRPPSSWPRDTQKKQNNQDSCGSLQTNEFIVAEAIVGWSLRRRGGTVTRQYIIVLAQNCNAAMNRLTISPSGRVVFTIRVKKKSFPRNCLLPALFPTREKASSSNWMLLVQREFISQTERREMILQWF